VKQCHVSNIICHGKEKLMEIERKFIIQTLPPSLDSCQFHLIEQAYLNTDPVVRIRRQDNEFYLTYKGKGLLAREEYNLPLNEESYYHLRRKADGNIITKKRYLIPLPQPAYDEHAALSVQERKNPLTIELDVFDAPFAPLMIAEVEFSSEHAANAFLPPPWFGQDVTFDPQYHNSNLSQRKF
jgi:Uncharacterized protein conserved in bacteria